ncbi:hypothetical protein GCM10023223_40940 [Stackebrandtia albiflava]
MVVFRDRPCRGGLAAGAVRLGEVGITGTRAGQGIRGGGFPVVGVGMGRVDVGTVDPSWMEDVGAVPVGLSKLRPASFSHVVTESQAPQTVPAARIRTVIASRPATTRPGGWYESIHTAVPRRAAPPHVSP